MKFSCGVILSYTNITRIYIIYICSYPCPIHCCRSSRSRNHQVAAVGIDEIAVSVDTENFAGKGILRSEGSRIDVGLSVSWIIEIKISGSSFRSVWGYRNPFYCLSGVADIGIYRDARQGDDGRKSHDYRQKQEHEVLGWEITVIDVVWAEHGYGLKD